MQSHMFPIFGQKEINLAITNISGVKTHNPIGEYWAMFAQHTGPDQTQFQRFPNSRPFLRGASQR